ncbi:MAG: shikimate dehydrogenase [Lachnospiraceae bacterium]|nr:shikimate dehydrogenase [Lachnospiraceae bacterium]
MININGHTSVYGIIGNPITHTMSPAIHNTISRAMGIDSVYVPFVANDDLKSIVRGLYSLGVKGINVTVPYKTDIIYELCGLEPLAMEIGAVNTLQYTEHGYYGFNTDILGLKRELEDEKISLQGRDAVILGAGGAARAVAFLCASQEASSITIINRSLNKALEIRADVAAYAAKNGLQQLSQNVNALTLKEAGRAVTDGCIAFQCTNVGLSPNDDTCVVHDGSFYRRVAVGVDLIYKPAETMFMKYVQSAGGAAYNGLKMLVYQAVSAYEIWHGVKVPDVVVYDVERSLR